MALTDLLKMSSCPSLLWDIKAKQKPRSPPNRLRDKKMRYIYTMEYC